MSSFIRTSACLLLAAFLLAPAAAMAQTSVVQQQIGSFEYTDTNRGTRYTTQTIGNFRYTTGSDGSRATTQQIGSFRYTTVKPGWRDR